MKLGLMPMCTVLPDEEPPDWSADDDDSNAEGDLSSPLEPPQPEGSELKKVLGEFADSMAARKYAFISSPFIKEVFEKMLIGAVTLP